MLSLHADQGEIVSVLGPNGAGKSTLEVRFHLPMRPGDVVHVLAEWLERRESASKGDRGVVTVRFSLINQRGDSVMSHLDKILVRRRLAASPSTP